MIALMTKIKEKKVTHLKDKMNNNNKNKKNCLLI